VEAIVLAVDREKRRPFALDQRRPASEAWPRRTGGNRRRRRPPRAQGRRPVDGWVAGSQTYGLFGGPARLRASGARLVPHEETGEKRPGLISPADSASAIQLQGPRSPTRGRRGKDPLSLVPCAGTRRPGRVSPAFKATGGIADSGGPPAGPRHRRRGVAEGEERQKKTKAEHPSRGPRGPKAGYDGRADRRGPLPSPGGPRASLLYSKRTAALVLRCHPSKFLQGRIEALRATLRIARTTKGSWKSR